MPSPATERTLSRWRATHGTAKAFFALAESAVARDAKLGVNDPAAAVATGFERGLLPRSVD